MKFLLSSFFLLPFLIFSQNSYDQAEIYFQNGKYDQAEHLFLIYLKEKPSDRKTREYLGDISGHSKDWDTAIWYYEGLLKEDINSANYNYKYGGALGMKALEVNKILAVTYIGDIKRSFENAAELDSNHIEVRWALVEFYLQLPGILGGSETKAMKYATELEKISPVDGYLAKGYIAEYGDNFKVAESYYKKAIEVGGSPLCYEKLVSLYDKYNRPEQALEVYRQSLKIKKYD